MRREWEAHSFALLFRGFDLFSIPNSEEEKAELLLINFAVRRLKESHGAVLFFMNFYLFFFFFNLLISYSSLIKEDFLIYISMKSK